MTNVAVNEGDLIMSIAATVGKPIILKMKACIHDGFIVFTNLSKSVDVEFLYYLLIKMENKIASAGQHGTQSNINTELVSLTQFAKPPVSEQQKMVSIISNIDRYIQSQKSKSITIKGLKKGLMQQLLTGMIRVKV